MNAGSSPIPSRSFLEELQDDEFRDGFVADHVRTRLALLIRTLREQRGWSQTDLARVIGTTQSVVSRLEDPDYGKLSLRTVFEVAAAFKLPVYIDMPNWDEWFRLMEDMSSRNLQRQSFDVFANDNAEEELLEEAASVEYEPVAASHPGVVFYHEDPPHYIENIGIDLTRSDSSLIWAAGWLHGEGADLYRDRLAERAQSVAIATTTNTTARVANDPSAAVKRIPASSIVPARSFRRTMEEELSVRSTR